MATMTSRLLVSLVDGVTAPARRASQGLLGIPRAVRQANGQMTTFTQRLDTAISRNAASMDRARGRMIDAVAGAYLLRGGFNATAGAAMSLEDKMADIAKVSGMSEAELKAFEGTLRNLARKEIPLAVEELADLAAAASQSGIANSELEDFTRMVAKAAVAWDMSGAKAGESLAKIKTALGLTIPETQKYADTINFLSDSTASSADDLVEFSRRVAADGKIAGFTNEEVLALGATMISMGAQADVAATSLRNAGRMLSRGDFGAKKSQIKAMDDLGLSVEKVAKGMQVDASGTLLTVLEEISKAEPHKKLALMSGIFGDEARALMPLLSELDKTRDMIEQVGDATNYLGSVQKEFETRSRTGSYAIQRFKNQLRDVAIVIGQSLLPAMKQLLDAAAPYLIGLSDMISRHPKLVAGLLAAASGLIAFRVALAAISFIGLAGRGGALSLLSLGMNTVGRAGAGLWGAARASVALQTALGAMSGGQTIGILGKIAVASRGMLFAVPGVSMIASAIGAIGAAVATISAPVWGVFAVIAAAIAATGYTLFKYWDRITSVMSGVGRAIGEILAPAIEAIRPALDWLAPIGDVIAAGWQKAKEVLASVGEWLSSFFTREVLSDGDKAKYEDAGYDAIMALWNGMKAVMSDLVAWVSEKASILASPFVKLGGIIRSAFPGGASIDQGGAVDEFSGLDGTRAKGGPVSAGGSYLVGEQGPEVVTASKSGYVHPNGKAPTSGSGGITIAPVFQFNGTPKETADQIVAKVMDRIERTIKTGLNGAYADNGLHGY